MKKLGLVARIALIVAAALFLSQLAVIIFQVKQGQKSPPPPYAIADRMLAVVRLLDDTPEGIREKVLAVADVTGFQVSIHPGIPATFKDDFDLSPLRAITQRKIRDYDAGRAVRSGTMPSDSAEEGAEFHFAIGLVSGETALFTVSDTTTLRIWNVPIGFFAGFFGIIVAIIAVCAVARETRPLEKLAKSVDELGNRIEPVQVAERGAKELRTLIRAINNMQKRILRLLSSRTIFLGAISHDLKTYLTRFRLRLEMMPPGTHRDKAIMDVEAMEQILNDALLFASESSAHSRGEVIDINDAVEHSAAGADAAGDRIEMALASQSLEVRVPRAALHRIIDNLFSNALRYGKCAKAVTEIRGTMACLIIEDDGTGIRDEDLPFVFEPFFRAEPSRNRAHGGTGLGLSIVKQILDAHGGEITLSNKSDGTGLLATVCLPLATVSNHIKNGGAEIRPNEGINTR